MQRSAGTVAAAFLFAAAVCLGPQPAVAGSPRSEVRVVDGTPRILVDGKDAIRTINQIYYFPTYSRKDGSLDNNYRRGVWLDGVRRQIDRMAGLGANTLTLQVWWAEMAAERSVDFGPLDQAMRYAAQKGVFVILAPKVDGMPPQWWARENDFPDPSAPQPCVPQEKGAAQACIPREICAPGDERCCSRPAEELVCCSPDLQPGQGDGPPPAARLAANGMLACRPVSDNRRYRTCTTCETDSYGWKYGNPGWSGERFQEDFGGYLTALVERYRDAPALIGWLLSLGPTGEDMYGPSYIVLRSVYGDLSGAAKADQVSDYSEDAQRRFREWIAGRYASDEQLRKAWGDPSLSLRTVRLPDPRKLFRDGRPAPFPDDFFLHFFVELEVLTSQGRDLYDFREQVRNRARSRLTKLVKGLDPRHVLVYGGTNNEGVFADPNIDVVQGNNHVESALNGLEESNVIAVVAALNAKRGKASTFGIESIGDDSGLVRGASGRDRRGQKDALKHAAQTIRCSGGYFGFASEIEGAGGFLPTWNEEDQQILPEIAAFAPARDCVCGLVPAGGKVQIRHTVGEFVDLLGLQDRYRCARASAPVAGSAPARAVAPSPAAEPRGQPDAALPPKGPSGQEQRVFPSGLPTAPAGAGRPYCGDKLCDDFEKANPGMCPDDCGGAPARGRAPASAAPTTASVAAPAAGLVPTIGSVVVPTAAPGKPSAFEGGGSPVGDPQYGERSPVVRAASSGIVSSLTAIASGALLADDFSSGDVDFDAWRLMPFINREWVSVRDGALRIAGRLQRPQDNILFSNRPGGLVHLGVVSRRFPTADVVAVLRMRAVSLPSGEWNSTLHVCSAVPDYFSEVRFGTQRDGGSGWTFTSQDERPGFSAVVPPFGDEASRFRTVKVERDGPTGVMTGYVEGPGGWVKVGEARDTHLFAARLELKTVGAADGADLDTRFDDVRLYPHPDRNPVRFVLTTAGPRFSYPAAGQESLTLRLFHADGATLIGEGRRGSDGAFEVPLSRVLTYPIGAVVKIYRGGAEVGSASVPQNGVEGLYPGDVWGVNLQQ